jgi:hypothetical protein
MLQLGASFGKTVAGFLTISVLGVLVVFAQGPKGNSGKAGQSGPPNLEWAEEVFVDYGVPTHAGPGPHPGTVSDNFKLMQGGMRWLGGGDVEYRIIGTAPFGGANTAIELAEATLDEFITTRAFTHHDPTTQTNPCTGAPNTVQWAGIDGAGGILGTTSVCQNVATKAIGGFVITLDGAESWGSTSEDFDVQNIATHEWLHVGGLGHVHAPQDGCLTAYFLAATGEIQKRTLGLGDKLGMDFLYSTEDTTSGPGCGA